MTVRVGVLLCVFEFIESFAQQASQINGIITPDLPLLLLWLHDRKFCFFLQLEISQKKDSTCCEFLVLTEFGRCVQVGVMASHARTQPRIVSEFHSIFQCFLLFFLFFFSGQNLAVFLAAISCSVFCANSRHWQREQNWSWLPLLGPVPNALRQKVSRKRLQMHSSCP